MTAKAFTLIEVMSVVALIGILAASTAWSLADHVQARSHDNVIMMIHHMDALSRVAARRLGQSCELCIDLGSQRITRASSEDTPSRVKSHSFMLPRGCRVDRVILSAQPHDNFVTTARSYITINSGTATLPYSTSGQSMSIAMRLTYDDPPSSKWLVFSGLTGQMITTTDEQEINNLFQYLVSARNDAH